MALASLYNVPTNSNELNIFSFANQDEHNKIAAAVLLQYNTPVPSFVLDPVPLNDMGVWLQQHQLLHNIMNNIAGSNSSDLTDVNFQDNSQFSEWIWLHAQEHYQVADFLHLT